MYIDFFMYLVIKCYIMVYVRVRVRESKVGVIVYTTRRGYIFIFGDVFIVCEILRKINICEGLSF